MDKAKAEIRRGAKTNGVEISEDLLDRIQPPAKEEGEKEDENEQGGNSIDFNNRPK